MSSPPEFKHSTTCQKCKAPFSFINRKHHCRNCGNTYCGKCSMKLASIPSFGFVEPVRVCDKCYDDLRAVQRFVDVPTQSERVAAGETTTTTTASSPTDEAPTEGAEGAEPTSSEDGAPAPARKRVKNCNCGMPLCICPPDPETEEEKEEKKKLAEKKALEKKKEKPTTSSGPRGSTYAPGFQSSFLGFGQKQTREYDLKGDLNNQCREAIKAQDVEGVKLLLKSGAKADFKDRTGNTLLHLAAMFDNTETVRVLIQAGADPYVKNPDKESPIDIAPPALALKMKQMVPPPPAGPPPSTTTPTTPTAATTPTTPTTEEPASTS